MAMVNDETLTRREFTPKPNAPTSYSRGRNGLVAVTFRPPFQGYRKTELDSVGATQV
jgi:hypothetical protein